MSPPRLGVGLAADGTISPDRPTGPACRSTPVDQSRCVMSVDTVRGTAVQPAERRLVGTIAALRRYPVKSMLGEDLPATEVTAYGLDGDRSHAVIDRTTGKVASAKHPRHWQ